MVIYFLSVYIVDLFVFNQLAKYLFSVSACYKMRFVSNYIYLSNYNNLFEFLNLKYKYYYIQVSFRFLFNYQDQLFNLRKKLNSSLQLLERLNIIISDDCQRNSLN